MKFRYLPTAEMDVQLLEDTVTFLLNGFVPAPGQTLVSTAELLQMATRSLDKVHIELIRSSHVQVQLDH